MRVSGVNSIARIGAIEPINRNNRIVPTKRINKISKNKQVTSLRSNIYTNFYLLDISQRGLEYMKLFEKDSVPIVNSDILFYNKNLEFIYK